MPLDAIDTYIIHLCILAEVTEFIFYVDPTKSSFHVPFNLSLGKTYTITVKASRVYSHKTIATYTATKWATITFRTGTLLFIKMNKSKALVWVIKSLCVEG